MLPQGVMQDFDFFRGIPSEEVALLTAGAEHLVHKHRDVVFGVGESASHFGLVLRGCYKLTRPRVAETLLSLAVRGEPVGLLMMPHPTAVYPVTVQSIGMSQFLRIPRATYLDSWLRSPEAMRRAQAAIALRCQGFHADRGAQHLPLEKRIADFLLRCLDRYVEENTGTLRFPLSRREVGAAVGAQVESVIRVMSRWEKTGIISTSSQFIQVVSSESLVQILSAEEERNRDL